MPTMATAGTFNYGKASYKAYVAANGGQMFDAAALQLAEEVGKSGSLCPVLLHFLYRVNVLLTVHDLVFLWQEFAKRAPVYSAMMAAYIEAHPDSFNGQLPEKERAAWFASYTAALSDEERAAFKAETKAMKGPLTALSEEVPRFPPTRFPRLFRGQMGVAWVFCACFLMNRSTSDRSRAGSPRAALRSVRCVLVHFRFFCVFSLSFPLSLPFFPVCFREFFFSLSLVFWTRRSSQRPLRCK
jgi:hypothetical protein